LVSGSIGRHAPGATCNRQVPGSSPGVGSSVLLWLYSRVHEWRPLANASRRHPRTIPSWRRLATDDDPGDAGDPVGTDALVYG